MSWEGEKMPTILIVDDKPGVRQLLAEELAFQGYTVMAIGNVASVNEIIRFSSLDLVIMDPHMKGQHRWDLLLDIKHQDPHQPVLIVTESASYRRDLRSTVAAGLLVKSFNLNDLFQKLAEILHRKEPYPNREARPVPKSPPYPIQRPPSIDDPAVLVGSDRKAAMNLAFL
jgi:DNA-binding NtrC family response regulator